MASQPPLQPGPSLGRPEIVTAALAVAEEAAGKPYRWGGHTTRGFDCSGFVIYTLQQAFPNVGWTFITAGSIMADSRFERVTNPQPGDLIGFPRSRGSVDHIGIVVDAAHWIGSQSSTGVAQVAMSNVYWSRRTHIFLRLK
jgi:cell wall-associated NlpC family hydrolase